MNKVSVAKLGDLPDLKPKCTLVGEVDLVAVPFDEGVSVLCGS